MAEERQKEEAVDRVAVAQPGAAVRELAERMERALAREERLRVR